MGEDRGCSATSVLLAFLIGGVVGAGLGLALAPSSGAQTRDKIRKIADDTTEKLKDTIEEGKKVFEEGREIISSVFSAGKEAMKKEREKLLSQPAEPVTSSKAGS